jgi:hypothetical protein
MLSCYSAGVDAFSADALLPPSVDAGCRYFEPLIVFAFRCRYFRHFADGDFLSMPLR